MIDRTLSKLLPTLDNNNIQIFSLLLPKVVKKKTLLDKFWDLLDEQEKNRAQRLINSKLRNSFVATRAILKLITANYLNISPQNIDFIYNKNGKPSLKPPKPLHFNISHSHQRALFAFNKDYEIGVDIEKIGTSKSYLDIAKRFFTKEEYQTLVSSKKNKQAKVFYSLWTRKEALVKAQGGTIYQHLEAKENNNDFFIEEIIVDKNYKASLATRNKENEFTINEMDAKFVMQLLQTRTT